MKFVIQRVTNASCTVDGNIIGQIEKGFCVFIGVSNEDTTEIADKIGGINMIADVSAIVHELQAEIKVLKLFEENTHNQ